MGQPAGVFVVSVEQAAPACRVTTLSASSAALGPRRAEEDDGVLDPVAAEARHRLQVLGEDADHPGVGAIQELGFL